MRFGCLIILLVTSLQLELSSQAALQNHEALINVNFNYGLSFPAGDLKERYGQSFVLGVGSEYITGESSFIMGIEGFFQFGSRVKEDVLSSLRTSNGQILGINSQYADVFLRQRGMSFSLVFGKILSFSKNNKSGIRISISPGIYKHYIKFKDENQAVPQLSEPYQQGYDRLTGGFSMKEFIGYQHMSADHRLNVYFGVESVQAFTKNRRAINFDTMSGDNLDRLDILFQIKVGLIIPFYIGDSNEVRYY